MQTQARKTRCGCLNMNMEEHHESCHRACGAALHQTPSFVTSTDFRGTSLTFPSRGKDSSNHKINEDRLDISRRVEVQLSLGVIQVTDTSDVTLLPALMIYTAKFDIVLKRNCWSPTSVNWSQLSFVVHFNLVFYDSMTHVGKKLWSLVLMRNLKTSAVCIFRLQSFQREKGISNIFQNLIIFLSYHIHFWMAGNTILADLTLPE